LQPVPDPVAEGQRLMTICNACRYCEGYCAVFPAMERRPAFTAADIRYLANLCHNCAECYYACQYAPPHEFAVNVPQVFAQARVASYEAYARPRWIWTLLRGWGSLLAWFAATAVILLAVNTSGTSTGFYAVIPHPVMVAIFLAAAAWVTVGMVAGVMAFWRESGGSPGLSALISGLRDAFALTNLQSGGAGCTYPDEYHSHVRRWFHHATFYGFLLCFASTTVAAVYHYALGREGPHPYLSAPVILGTLGGIGLLVGPVGLYVLKLRRDPNIVDARQDGMDATLLAMLFATSLTGLLLMLLRGTEAMQPLLIVHLAVVLAFFLTLPYGKFVHGLYRTAALVRHALEGGKPR